MKWLPSARSTNNLMGTIKDTKLIRWFLLLATVSFPMVTDAQYYDLTVGTERHIARCYGINAICPASEHFETAIEKVIDEVEVDGKWYAVIVFRGWEGTDAEGNPTQTVADTTLYRMEGSILYENIDGEDRAIFDFGFAIGDSLRSILAPYVDVEDLVDYWVDQQVIAPLILGDTLFHFPDGLDRNIIWGSSIIVTAQGDTLPSDRLEFTIEDHLPRPEFQLFNPFLYIEGMGVMLTAPTHRGRVICGFKTAQGEHFGCKAPLFPVSIENSENLLPRSLEILGNYPNPFNPSTTINYQLHKSGTLKVSLYTSSGMQVGVLRNEFTQAGYYSIAVDMADYASGVYIVVFEFDFEIQAQPISFIK